MTGLRTAPSRGDPATIIVEWGLRIPMQDGVTLAATLYRPKQLPATVPGIVTITPYIADSAHEAGIFFAAQGFLLLAVDCRGRGNSDGEFVPYKNDGSDGAEVVEWLARHPLCNGRVAMAGGSYSGFNQWATASLRPPHLACLMPLCASYPGLDFPIRNNIGEQYTLQWLSFTAGRTLQTSMFTDQPYWSQLWRERFVAGRPYASLADEQPKVSNILGIWLEHPEPDEYWDRYTPSPDDYAAMSAPVLTMTGYYDDDQHGALAYHRAVERYGSDCLRENNFLIIGPWDHAGVGGPGSMLDGVEFGIDSVVDRRALGLEWYRWVLAGGPRPARLRDRVCYYVAGAGHWRHAPSLDAVTAKHVPLYLDGKDQPRHSQPGNLGLARPPLGQPHCYRYDPLDVSLAALETEILPYNISDTRLHLANDGNQLVYDSAPLVEDTELSGFFRLDVWIGIDQPDTDFRVLIYLVEASGRHILLTNDTKRARYRRSLREPCVITSAEPQLYSFDTFWFMSRKVKTGERLRLIFGPFNSIYTQKNYNSGKLVADECRADAQTVSVSICIGGGRHASVLYMPVAAQRSNTDDRAIPTAST